MRPVQQSVGLLCLTGVLMAGCGNSNQQTAAGNKSISADSEVSPGSAADGANASPQGSSIAVSSAAADAPTIQSSSDPRQVLPDGAITSNVGNEIRIFKPDGTESIITFSGVVLSSRFADSGNGCAVVGADKQTELVQVTDGTQHVVASSTDGQANAAWSTVSPDGCRALVNVAAGADTGGYFLTASGATSTPAPGVFVMNGDQGYSISGPLRTIISSTSKAGLTWNEMRLPAELDGAQFSSPSIVNGQPWFVYAIEDTSSERYVYHVGVATWSPERGWRAIRSKLTVDEGGIASASHGDALVILSRSSGDGITYDISTSTFSDLKRPESAVAGTTLLDVLLDDRGIAGYDTQTDECNAATCSQTANTWRVAADGSSVLLDTRGDRGA